MVAYYAKYIDAYSAIELKKKLVAYDRTLLIADPRRMEPKKFGGRGARARRQKRCASACCYGSIRLTYALQLPVKAPRLCFPAFFCCITFSAVYVMAPCNFYEDKSCCGHLRVDSTELQQYTV